MKNILEKFNKLSMPTTILIASVIFGGFVYGGQLTKQGSIEKQQQVELQAKAKIEQELALCLSDTQRRHSEQTNLEQKLADSDKQISDLKSANSNLQSKSDDQDKQDNSQKVDIAQAQFDIQATQSMVAKQQKCAADISRWCISSFDASKEAYDKMLNKDDCVDLSSTECKKLKIKNYQQQFDNCQKAKECK